MSGFDLAYIALAVRDRAAAEAVLGDDLGLVRREVEAPGGPVPAFGVGRTALVALESGDPFLSGTVATGVDHIALAASEPLEAATAHGLEAVADAPTAGLNGGRQVVVDARTTAPSGSDSMCG